MKKEKNMPIIENSLSLVPEAGKTWRVSGRPKWQQCKEQEGPARLESAVGTVLDLISQAGALITTVYNWDGVPQGPSSVCVLLQCIVLIL